MKNLREELLSRDRGIFEDDNVSKEQIDKLLALFRQAIGEVVGEKEGQGNLVNERIEQRNQLRAEQRARFNQIMPKE
jgi:hypothetical protein